MLLKEHRDVRGPGHEVTEKVPDLAAKQSLSAQESQNPDLPFMCGLHVDLGLVCGSAGPAEGPASYLSKDVEPQL